MRECGAPESYGVQNSTPVCCTPFGHILTMNNCIYHYQYHSQPFECKSITIFSNIMLIWVSYLLSYFCFCHKVFSKRKFWIGLWSGVWIALQKYCWSDPRIALQKLYWIGVWIAFQKFWSVQCTAYQLPSKSFLRCIHVINMSLTLFPGKAIAAFPYSPDLNFYQ